MGERRFIWLKEASATHANIMADFVQKRQTDAFLLMSADNLSKSAALRSLFEDLGYGERERAA